MFGRALLASWLLALGSLIGGCSGGDTSEEPSGTSSDTATTTDTGPTGVCPVILYGSIDLFVVDDVSGDDVCDATVVAMRDGEQLTPTQASFGVEQVTADSCIYDSTFRVAGLVTLVVNAPGYEEAVSDEVMVPSSSGCDAEYPPPVEVEVRLTPSDG